MRWTEIINENKYSWLGIDNPGGDWLEGARKKAIQSKNGIGNKITAYTRKPVLFPVKYLIDLEGYNGEHRFRNDFDAPKHDKLMTSVTEKGFDNHDYPILIGVNHFGKAYIMEGNHRVAVASRLGVKAIWVTIQWYAGSEEENGLWHPEVVDTYINSASRINESFDGGELNWLDDREFEFDIDGVSFKAGLYKMQYDEYDHFMFMSRAGGQASAENTGLMGARATKVMGYIVKGLEELLDKHPGVKVKFSADKGDNKDKLYMAMARKLKPRANAKGYVIWVEEEDGHSIFGLEPK